jgi:3-hydroxyisobutyrate dehydrogenase
MFKIGICGIGKMGSEITKRLIECNQTVSIWNRTKGKMEELKKIGAIVTEEIKELISISDIIIIIMGDDKALDYIYNSPEGLKNINLHNKIIIEMSTTSISKIKSLEEIVVASNGEFIECPVGGSTQPAREGNLLGLVGGKYEVFKKIEGLLKLICRRYEHLGVVGKGSAMKLAINLPLMVYWQSLGEALAITTNNGIDFDKALDIMMDTSGAAKIAHLKTKAISDAMNNSPNIKSSFKVSSSLKDMKLMIEEIKKLNKEFHVINGATKYVAEAAKEGWSDCDASLVSVYINKKLNNYL